MFFHFVVKRLTCNAQLHCHGREVSVAFFEGLSYHTHLHFFERGRCSFLFLNPLGQLEQFGRKIRIIADDDGFLDDVFQLSDVAVPRVELQFFASAVRQFDGWFVILFAKAEDKAFGKRYDVFGAFATKVFRGVSY